MKFLDEGPKKHEYAEVVSLSVRSYEPEYDIWRNTKYLDPIDYRGYNDNSYRAQAWRKIPILNVMLIMRMGDIAYMAGLGYV